MKDSLRVETVQSLARRLEVSANTIVRAVMNGDLPYVNVGGHWRFREVDIAYWLRRAAPKDPQLKVVAGGAIAKPSSDSDEAG